MGLGERLLGGGEKAPSSKEVATLTPGSTSDSPRTPRLEFTYSPGGEQDLVTLTGTMTFAKGAVVRLAKRHGIDAGGYLESGGTLQREPENPADPMAVAVHVEGEKIGYLPGYLARHVDLSVGAARQVRVQIFTELLPKGLRAEAWAWLASGDPNWYWSETNRPPLSSGAKVATRQADINKSVADALATGGLRAAPFEAGMVHGVHYLQLVEPIKQLKRDGRMEDALMLCYAAIQGAEEAREGREPAPWYTEQAAIIHRKLGQRDDEVAVLRRWLAICPPDRREGSRIKQRLEKLA